MKRPKPGPEYVAEYSRFVRQLLRERAAIPREELEYLATAADRLKDERLKAAIAGLIGWSDDDRAEIETFFAVAIEVMKDTTLSKIRKAVQTVEIRFLIKDKT